MFELKSVLLAKMTQAVPSFLRARVKSLQRSELNRAHKRLAKLKKEKDAIIDEMDVALRAMQLRRRQRGPDARLTGQYSIDEMRPITGGVVYDIEKLTMALDDNRRQTADEESRIDRLSKVLVSP